MPRAARAFFSRRSSVSGNGANCAVTAGRRRTAVTCRSGVSGRSMAPAASRSSAASSAFSVCDRRAGSMAQHRTSEANKWQTRRGKNLRAKGLEARPDGVVVLPSQPMATPRPEGRLPRTLGLWSSVALVIGITIGSGIFRSPAGIARQAPNPLVMLGLWIGGGAITLCGALSLAEIAAALPQTGGIYAYLREAWGRRAAFLFGWSELILIRASALGGIAVVFGEYLLRSIGIDPAAHVLAARALSAGAIVFAAAANIRGANVGALIVGIATWAKFGALSLLVVAAFALGQAHGASLEHLTAPSTGPLALGS